MEARPKTKRHKLKFADATTTFATTVDHPAIANADMPDYLTRGFDGFGQESSDQPYVVVRYDKCAVYNFCSSVRFEVVPVLGELEMSMGLNGSECWRD